MKLIIRYKLRNNWKLTHQTETSQRNLVELELKTIETNSRKKNGTALPLRPTRILCRTSQKPHFLTSTVYLYKILYEFMHTQTRWIRVKFV